MALQNWTQFKSVEMQQMYSTVYLLFVSSELKVLTFLATVFVVRRIGMHSRMRMRWSVSGGVHRVMHNGLTPRGVIVGALVRWGCSRLVGRKGSSGILWGLPWLPSKSFSNQTWYDYIRLCTMLQQTGHVRSRPSQYSPDMFAYVCAAAKALAVA